MAAVPGTTISPCLFVRQASREVEKQLRRTVKAVSVAPGIIGTGLLALPWAMPSAGRLATAVMRVARVAVLVP